MRAVTVTYAIRRWRNVRGLLGWSAQNEMRLYGYLTLPRPWEMTPRLGFSIARWLDPDRDYYRFDDEPMPRYSESMDFPLNNYGAVRHPWEDDPCRPIEQFHDRKDIRKYLDRIFDRLTYRELARPVSVMYTPYGGLPIISTIDEHGKVTIY